MDYLCHDFKMAVQLSHSSSQPDLDPRSHFFLPLIRLSLTTISLSFLLVALVLYSFDISQLGRTQLMILAVILPAILTPIVSWQHAKRSALIEKMQEDIRLASRQDDVTGLLSRRFFYEQAHRELQLAARHAYPVALLLLKLEPLADIQARLSHLMRDYAFRSCATMLKEALRETDVLARFSEDSFVILMPHNSLSEAEEVAHRLQRKLESTAVTLDKETLHLHLSLGLSVSQDNHHLQHLVDMAEQALELSSAKARIAALRSVAS